MLKNNSKKSHKTNLGQNRRKSFFLILLVILPLSALIFAAGTFAGFGDKPERMTPEREVTAKNSDLKINGNNGESAVSLTRPDNFYLKFPVPNRTAASVVINSVMDHHNASPELFYRPDNQVVGFTGEMGDLQNGGAFVANFGHGNLYQVRNLQHSDFVLNGSVGDSPSYLAYDGHQGLDFKTTDQTNTAANPLRMLAAESGTLTCASDSVKTAVIDHGNGFRTRYLHMTDRLCENGQSISVSAGQPIGRIFNSGTGGIHAHFEVQTLIGGQWKTIDPYGWQGQYPDPRGNGSSTNLWKPVTSTSDRATRWHPDGTLITDVTDGNHTVYLVEGGQRWGIPSESVFYAYGFDFSNVVKVSHAEFLNLPAGGIMNPPPSGRLRNSGSTVYEIVSRGSQLYKRGFPSLAAFYGQGFQWSDVVNQSVAGIPDDPFIPVYSSPFRDGTLVAELDETVTPAVRRIKPNTPVYIISNSKKRAFTNENSFLNLMGSSRAFDDVLLIKRNVLNAIASGPNICESTTTSGVACGGGFTNDVYPPSVLINNWLFGTNFDQTNSSFVVTSGTIVLTGTGTDAESGDNGIQTVTVNGVRAGNDTSTGSGTANWTKNLQLVPGTNTIVVEVTDNSANHNRSQQTISIDYQPPNNDVIGPILAISSPGDGATVDTQQLTVTGIATDGGVGDNGVSSVTVNGVPATGGTVQGSDVAYWTATVNLNIGTNNITVVARDNSPNQNSNSQIISVNVTNPGQTTIPVDYTWSGRQPLPASLYDSATVTLNGKIHILGGRGPAANSANKHFRYDPATNQWETLADIPLWGITEGGATVLNGKIYAFRSALNPTPGGGSDYAMKIYDPATNSWTVGASLALGNIYGTSLVTVGDRIFEIGGTNQFLTGFNAVNEYDAANNVWIPRSPLPRARGYSVVKVIRGFVYVMGGIGYSPNDYGSTFVDIYNPQTDSWTTGNPAPYNFWDAASTVISIGNRPPFTSYRIIIMGGKDNTHTIMPFVFEYDPDTENWRQLNSLPVAVTGGVGSVINSNLYLCGGDIGSGAVNTTYQGTPLQWAPDLTITASSNTIDSNTNASLFVRLGTPAAASSTVTLSSSDPSILPVPASVTFNAGETLKTVPVHSTQLNTGSVVITAQLPPALGSGVAATSVSVVAVAPSVFMNPASEITGTTAVISGLVNPNSAATNAWFEWSPDIDFSQTNFANFQNLGSGNAAVPISFRLDGLLPNTTYYYRIVAANNGGWNRPPGVISFTTTASSIVSRPPFDFDGDGKTDIAVFRPSDGSWWYSRSLDSQYRVYSFGNAADRIVPGDYTGDHKTDIAVFRPATGFWFIQRSEDNSYFSFPFGASGDIPAPSDYDGDGRTDPAVFRPSTATWYISQSTGGTAIINFGGTADKPVPADYDGDGKADIAIFRPSDGSWWYLRSSDSTYRVYSFGTGTDSAVPGDYTGDGKADIAVFRASTGTWFVQRSEDGSYFSFPFGANGDLPAPGDYDGDGRFDSAVFRPSTATWYLNRTTAGVGITAFGATGDLPVPNAFIR
ncbi:MAG: VCBS repeat-containing protein [Acidobacteria bacterium]|nr:VCBS repeat-containing protein [Acidobacteriota bacterium]